MTRPHYYWLWQGIKQRCFNPNHMAYENYGRRGITISSEWVSSYEAFRDWVETNLGPKPKGYTIDRIDVNGNYEPGNLRWVTWDTQQQNKRNNKLSLEAARHIRALAKLGHTKTSIARTVGVSEGMIRQILSNKAWREKEGEAA